jgi:hypothetical protein
MKPGLQRIEATLMRLDKQLPPPQATPPQRTVSFNLSPRSAPSGISVETEGDAPPASSSNQDLLDLPTFKGNWQDAAPPPPVVPSIPVTAPISFTVSSKAMPAGASASPLQERISEMLHPYPAKESSPLPNLPKSKLPNFSNSRHVTNPEFALKLLKEIEGMVSAWQRELQNILLKIQDLYLEGPVIDGWLESQTSETKPSSGPVVLRHAEIEKLMEYVEDICKLSELENSEDPPRTDYRLCGLDADGQLWSRPCPTEQVPIVSLAIARYPNRAAPSLHQRCVLRNYA